MATEPDSSTAPTESRRERLRRELKADVVTIARQQLESGGRAGVSWRALAKEVGMNPASLYTYFDNLDDVFTAVILDSFNRLADTLQLAAAKCVDGPARDRLVSNALTFRQWALDHPAEFNLIFTDQIPGYAAPPDGPTVEVQLLIFEPFIEAISELLGQELNAKTFTTSGEATESIGLWAMMHGLVMLEINHHFAFIEDRETLFIRNLERAIDSVLA